MLERSLLVLAVALLPATALAFQDEPDGFAGARFGMSSEQVKKLLPTLKEVGRSPDRVLAMYEAEQQSFDEIEGCKVTLGFIGDRLYEIRFDCGRDERIATILRAKFGVPSAQEEKLTIWRGEQAVVSMNRQVRTFALASPALTKAAHQYFMQQALTAAQSAQQSHPPDKAKQGQPAPPQESGAAGN